MQQGEGTHPGFSRHLVSGLGQGLLWGAQGAPSEKLSFERSGDKGPFQCA